MPNGTSVLCVLVDPDADAVDCREAAFEAVNGRPISSYEQFILKVAEKL